MNHYAARGGPSHGHSNMHKKSGEDRTCSSQDMIADWQTDTLITILCSHIRGGVQPTVSDDSDSFLLVYCLLNVHMNCCDT